METKESVIQLGFLTDRADNSPPPPPQGQISDSEKWIFLITPELALKEGCPQCKRSAHLSKLSTTKYAETKKRNKQMGYIQRLCSLFTQQGCPEVVCI